MSRYINMDDVITYPVMPVEYRKYQTRNLDDAYEQGWDDLQRLIEKMPTADVRENVHAEWVERECGEEEKDEGWETVIVCSHCDFPATTFYSEDCNSRTQIRTRFCPNCGADMRGEKDG